MSATGAELIRYLRTLAVGRANDACTDQQLLEQFVTRREQASFAALVRRHGPMVLGVCRRVLGHDRDAEDAFQATFLVLAKKAGSIRKHESISSWLHGVAFHVAQRLRAKEARRMVHERKAASRSPVDPAEEAAWREIRCLLDSELAHLPERYRGPLVLCYLQGKTQDEAARQLEWSLSTLRRRLDQARQILACRLRRRGLALSAALTAPVLMEAPATAGLPPLLAASTVRAGLAAATGQATGALVSAQVAALAEGGVGSMLVKKTSIAVVLLVSLTLGLGGLLAHRAIHSRTFAEAPAAPPAPAPQSQPTRSVSKDTAIEIKGRVLDPDGKPVAGACLFLLTAAKKAKGDAVVRAATDKDGRFSFKAEPPEFNAEGKATLAATAKGFGPAWTDVMAEKSDALTLQLVKDDLPIEGRVLDLEGQPIVGVTVYATRLMQGDLNAWFDARRKLHFPGLPGIELDRVNQSISCKTDKDGRFRLEGFGRERVVFVHMRGEKMANRDVDIVTRREVPRELSRYFYDVYPARFDYIVGPSKPILGTVREKRTGKPLAGITVYFLGSRPYVQATTDEQGRYRLTGVPKRQSYSLAAGGVPYFGVSKWDTADTPGLDPVIANFEIERGIAVRGRLLDKATGKPVKGTVIYLAPSDNPHLKDFTTRNAGNINLDDSQTGADGSFAVTAIPGPGLLCALANDVDRFCASEENNSWKVNHFLDSFHAVVPIDLDEKDAKPEVRNITLEPGKTLKGTVVDPDGRPLEGVFAAGLRAGLLPLRPGLAAGHPKRKLGSGSFTISGVKAGRQRTLVFFHPEKKLGKLLRLHGDEKGPLTVRLEPLGALAGRVVDKQGRPWAGRKVVTDIYSRGAQLEDKSLPREFLFADWGELASRKTTTDREGRFRIEGLIPGIKYPLHVVLSEGPQQTGAAAFPNARDLIVESGKTRDVGDLKINWLIPEKEAKEQP